MDAFKHQTSHYAAQIRIGGAANPWTTTRVVESPGVAIALANQLAKGWLGVAESRFEPMPDAYWEYKAAEESPITPKRKFKRKEEKRRTHKLWPQDFDGHVIEYLADKLEHAPEPQCRTCDHYLYDPSESRIPFCTLHK